jgi:Zn-dependent M28 family amino/carboxypeptidase
VNAWSRLERTYTLNSSGSYLGILLFAAASLLHAQVCVAESTVSSRENGAFAHVRALQDIATANGGNRAAGTLGYDRSADYVADRLRAVGYTVRFEEFSFPFFEERAPPVLRAVDPAADGLGPLGSGAIRTLANSGAGDVIGKLRPVDLGLAGGATPSPSTSGCEASDFEQFAPGAVALMRRGTCPFQVKVENAAAAGAAGVIIMNEGTTERTGIFAGRLTQQASVPVVGITYEAGLSLASTASNEGVSVRLVVDVLTGTRTTRNVVADSEGDPARTIVVGAHLDSVREGPGINDNASGSAAVLEGALRLAELPAGAGPRVRFAFWGAEEQGLVGSRHHVETLSEEEVRSIVLYINLDMVGSSNFGRFVQGAEAARETTADMARRALISYFRERNLAVEERVSARRRGFGSDDVSFIQKGTPTIGLHTGAGGTKGEAHAALFGGIPGRPFDPCYHKPCDTAENIDRSVLEEMAGALAHALTIVSR